MPVLGSCQCEKAPPPSLSPPATIPYPSAQSSLTMSDAIAIKLSPLHAIIAVLVLLAGGGAFTISHRTSGRTPEVDPEAIELVVSDAPEGSVVLDAADASM